MLTALFQADGQAAPGDITKFGNKKSSDHGSRSPKSGGSVKWRRLEPLAIHLTGTVPDEDKEAVKPVGYVLILAKNLPFFLAVNCGTRTSTASGSWRGRIR